MGQLFYILIILIVSSSIISAGNDTNILSTTTSLPNTTTLSPRLTYSSTVARSSSEKSLTTYDFAMTNHTFPTVSTTIMALLSSSQTGTTTVPGENSHSSSKRTSGHTTTTFTSLPITSSKSYNNKPTQHAVSSSVATLSVDVSGNSTPASHSNITTSEVTPAPAQALDNSLTMLAFGVMSLILILIVVMVILVTTINLRGRCKNTKQQEGIKNYDSMVTDSDMTNNCDKESITLVSVRTINTDYDTDSPQVSSVRSTIVDNEDQELNRDLLNIRGEL